VTGLQVGDQWYNLITFFYECFVLGLGVYEFTWYVISNLNMVPMIFKLYNIHIIQDLPCMTLHKLAGGFHFKPGAVVEKL
jgi:hypothetical protein